MSREFRNACKSDIPCGIDNGLSRRSEGTTDYIFMPKYDLSGDFTISEVSILTSRKLVRLKKRGPLKNRKAWVLLTNPMRLNERN